MTNDVQLQSVCIMRHIDDMLSEGRIFEANEYIDRAQIEQLPIRAAMAYLTAVRLIPCDVITSKRRLIERLRTKLTAEIGEYRTNEVIGNL